MCIVTLRVNKTLDVPLRTWAFVCAPETDCRSLRRDGRATCKIQDSIRCGQTWHLNHATIIFAKQKSFQSSRFRCQCLPPRQATQQPKRPRSR